MSEGRAQSSAADMQVGMGAVADGGFGRMGS